jgi:hypothetical protein
MMNSLLALFESRHLLDEAEYPSLLALVLLCCWRWTGMNMLYYLAGLKSIPSELYEAAESTARAGAEVLAHRLADAQAHHGLRADDFDLRGPGDVPESYMVFGNTPPPTTTA